MESVQTNPRKEVISANRLNRFAEHIDPLRRYRFSKRGWIITAVFIALALVPLLLFPLGPDEALFFVSGQKILRGAIHYRDIVDIKPPLIYYLYAAAIFLFGDTKISIAILDLLLQGLTCYLIIRVVRRASGNDLWAATAAVTYALLYITLNYGNVSQTESFAGLLGMSLLWLLMFRRTASGFLLVGVLGGLLFLLKFSLAIVLAAAAIAEIMVFDEGWQNVLKHWSMMLAGFSLIFALFLLYLFAFGAYHDFLLMQEFTRGYVQIQWASKSEWFKSVSKSMTAFLSDNYSMLALLATGVGIALSIPIGRIAVRRQSEHTDALRLLRICTLAFLLLLVTVAIEGKFLPYHFSRFYAFSVILAAFGGMSTFRMVMLSGLRDRFAWFVFPCLVLLLFIFSPITRYVFHGGGAMVNMLKGNAGFDNYYSRGENEYTQEELKEIGTYLRNHRRPGDQIFMASGIGGLICYEAGYIPDFKIYHFAFVAARFAPQEWKDAAQNYLFEKHPRFIVVQLRDYRPTLIGDMKPSNVTLRELPGVDSLMNVDYTLIRRTKVLELYERK